ncbi:MAG: helix-turn-helix transcriptional regulator [Clostridia bacterium]|nr:helix-turn-helix transcriptional regulator [Clostridia bacterium]
MSDRSLFGALIKSKRIQKNLTQNELALLLSVSKSAVSKWERGVSYPDITIVSNLCRVLDIKEEDFLRAVNQKADEPAHEDCDASGDALPVAPCPQERPSTLYSVLKWVFLGVFAFIFTLLGTRIESLHTSFLHSSRLFKLLFAPNSLSLNNGLNLFIFIFLILVSTAVIVFGVFYKRTEKSLESCRNGRKSRILAMLAGLFFFATSAVSIIAYAEILSLQSLLLEAAVLLGGAGIFLSALAKKRRLCACFVTLPLLYYTYRLVYYIIRFVSSSFNDSWLDSILLYLITVALMVLYIIKSLAPKARLNLPILLLCIPFGYELIFRIYPTESFISSPLSLITNSAFQASFILLAASAVNFKRSFITDSLAIVKRFSPFVFGTFATLFTIFAIMGHLFHMQVIDRISYDLFPLFMIFATLSVACLMVIVFVPKPQGELYKPAAMPSAAPRQGVMYTVCKWVCFGISLAIIVMIAIYYQSFENTLINNHFLENVVSALFDPKHYFHTYDNLRDTTLLLLFIIAVTVVACIIFMKKTPRTEVLENKQRVPAAIFGCACILVASIIFPFGTVYGRALTFTDFLACIPAVIGSIGIILSLLFKKRSLCGCFAMLTAAYVIIDLICHGAYISHILTYEAQKSIPLLFELIWPSLVQIALLCIYAVKCFRPHARLNIALVILACGLGQMYLVDGFINFCYHTLTPSYSDFATTLLNLGLVILALSSVTLKHSFVTDALQTLAIPTPFILGGIITFVLFSCVIISSDLDPVLYLSTYFTASDVAFLGTVSTACVLLLPFVPHYGRKQ